jgi:hypothetical protein
MDAYYYTVDNRDRSWARMNFDTMHCVEVWNGHAPIDAVATDSRSESLRILQERFRINNVYDRPSPDPRFC